jgi:DNA-binding NtrC family response regulator
MPEPTALLVGCSPSTAASIDEEFSGIDGLSLEECRGFEAACRRVRRPDVALVLAHAGDADGPSGVVRLLQAVVAARRPCPTLALADAFTEDQAAVLLRAGAADCLTLPQELSRLTSLADTLTRRVRLPQPATLDSPIGPDGPDGLGCLMEQVRRVAPQDVTLLLCGETGTGKTRLARLIHELSPRRGQPFLVVDCGALTPSLIESELFGHVKGAFTGADCDRAGKLAAAGRGTLLLDEVNSLPLPLQGKLLRAVDERAFEPVGGNSSLPVQARLIAASNVPLEREAAEGRFRRDLYYRLGVVSFALPPLRQRREAIPALAARFLGEFAARNRPEVTGLTAEAVEVLQRYEWPGNVRELRNAVERAVALCPGPEVGPDDLPETLYQTTPSLVVSGPHMTGKAETNGEPTTLSESLAEAEIRRISEALAKHRNNRRRAAAELGISRMGLYKKLYKYGLMERRPQAM